MDSSSITESSEAESCRTTIFVDPNSKVALSGQSSQEGSSASSTSPLLGQDPKEDAFRNLELANKVAIVTGASGRVGTATALLLAKRGAKVTIHGRDESKLLRLMDTLKEAGHESLAIAAGDIENPETRSKIVRITLSNFGQIDILINCAEKIDNWLPIYDTDAKYMKQMMQVHVDGPFELVKLAMPELKRQRGSIVFTSSIVAGTGLATGLAYAASKAAQSSIMKSIAVAQVHNGVRCNAVNPALHPNYRPHTRVKEEGAPQPLPKGPLRKGQAEDVAEMIAFLVSDAASFITGQEHYVDGGHMANFLEEGDISRLK